GFLCRSSGFDTIDTLEAALNTGYGRAAVLITAALNKGTVN
ncbi:MAG: hypothetical protein ACI8Q6_003433, partial [Granulosicoccus sp.]